jgi:hypothetical protein
LPAPELAPGPAGPELWRDATWRQLRCWQQRREERLEQQLLNEQEGQGSERERQRERQRQREREREQDPEWGPQPDATDSDDWAGRRAGARGHSRQQLEREERDAERRRQRRLRRQQRGACPRVPHGSLHAALAALVHEAGAPAAAQYRLENKLGLDATAAHSHFTQVERGWNVHFWRPLDVGGGGFGGGFRAPPATAGALTEQASSTRAVTPRD